MSRLKGRLLPLGALLALGAATACHKARSNEVQSMATPVNPPAASNPIRPTDADVAAAVRVSLEHDPGVDPATLRVASTDGVVELTGTTKDILTKRRAVRVAEAVKGVRAVSDRIELLLKGRPDADVAKDVQNALLVNPVTDAYELHTQASAGAVTLTGKVQSYQERLMAERVAEGVLGARSVQNDIQVQLGVGRSDAEVAADIKSSLRWDALINDGLINVDVHQGRVKLTGEVASAAEMRRAGIDAWVLGASQVDSAGLRVSAAAQQGQLMKNKLGAKSDGDISKAVHDAAAYDPRVSAADLKVSVTSGTATLSGSVGSVGGKMAAEDLARHTFGVVSVKNDLAIKPHKLVSDGVLQRSVRSGLLWNPYTNFYALDAKVQAGKVTLSGSVDTPFERAQATDIAANTVGVKDIDNDIVVRRSELVYVYNPYYFPYAPLWEAWYYAPAKPARSDSAIAEDIRDEFLWSPFVDESQVKVSVSNGTATLTGQVSSQVERMAATQDAFEGGATVVDDKLVIKGG